MPISNSAHLFSLIKSLTKADKRNFKLYAKRVQNDSDMMFLQLFDILEKLSSYDEDKIMSRVSGIDKANLSNLKRHLYSQILASLRLINTSRIKSIEIREHIDFAHILYSKSLYLQSLKILERAKRMAEEADLDIMVLEIIEFEKVIESRHITNTGPVKNDALTFSAKDVLDKVNASVTLSNVRVRLHGYYIKNSHVKNENEKREIVDYLRMNLPNVQEETLGLVERIYLYQCYVWYYYILLDFVACFENALKWVQTFEMNKELISLDPDLYMRGYHYVLTSAFNLQDIEKMTHYLDKLEKFRKSNYARFNENSKIFSFLYVHWARYNVHFLKGDYQGGLELIPRSLMRIKRYKERIAPHRIMVLYYKIAWMYVGASKPDKAIPFLNSIINEHHDDYREDIQIYSRLLFLMVHYDLENFDLLDYLSKMTESYFNKIKNKNRLQQRSLVFFRKVPTTSVLDRARLLIDFHNDLVQIRMDEYEKRAFLYLDITNWTSARILKQKQLRPMTEPSLTME